MASERPVKTPDRAQRILSALDAYYREHREMVLSFLATNPQFYGRFDLSIFATAGELTQHDVGMKKTTKAVAN